MPRPQINFRLPTAFIKALKQEASDRGMFANSLLAEILEDRYDPFGKASMHAPGRSLAETDGGRPQDHHGAIPDRKPAIMATASEPFQVYRTSPIS